MTSPCPVRISEGLRMNMTLTSLHVLGIPEFLTVSEPCYISQAGFLFCFVSFDKYYSFIFICPGEVRISSQGKVCCDDDGL